MNLIGPACRYVKGQFIQHASSIKTEDGETHVGYKARSEALEAYWKKVAEPPDNVTLADVSNFVQE
eukprot:1743849-Amphidinium_carterae.1